MTVAVPRESVEQEAVAKYLDACGVAWTHAPNGMAVFGAGKASPQRFAKLAKLKKAGVKTGVPDVLVFTTPPARPEFRGAAVELKRRRGPKGGTAHCAEFTDDERAWLRRLDAEGWAVPLADDSDEVVALYGAGEAIEFFKRLGYVPRATGVAA